MALSQQLPQLQQLPSELEVGLAPVIPHKRRLDESSFTSSTPSKSVRWKGETEARYFRKTSAPEILLGEEDEDEEDDLENEEDGRGEGEDGEGKGLQKVLALHAPGGEWIAAAFYEPTGKVLYVLEDTKDTVEWDLAVLWELKAVLEQWDPDLVIMSTETQDGLIDKVEDWYPELTPGSQHQRTCELQLYRIFTPAHASSRLSELRLAGQYTAVTVEADQEETEEGLSEIEEEIDRFAKYRDHGDEYLGMGKVRLSMVKLGCWVNVDAPRAISAAGGLLTYLSNCQSQEILRETDVPVDSIESMQLERHMLINQDALQSLAVFSHSSGASSHNTREKEGFSMFTLLKTTVTPLGHKLLHTWHLRPLADLAMIKSRHDAVALFSEGLNQEPVGAMTKAMKRIKNIPIHVRRLRRGRGGIREWRAVVDALLAAGEIRERILTMLDARHVQIAHKISGMISHEVREVQNDILRTIDFDESKDADRVCVRPGVDEELDQLRAEFQDLNNILAIVAVRVKQTMDPRWPAELEVQYFPSLGFLANVRPYGEDFVPPRAWSLLFSAEETTYWKTPETTRLDEEYGDIDTTIQAQEFVIVQALNDRVKVVEREIRSIMEIIAELDCLFALARAAIAHGLVRPTMVEEPVLEIRKGRHLLQENFVQSYIANDTMICGGSDGTHHNMMIVTGANGSGKSAYGRQVALIALMAQIGSFVPAESAVIGVVDKIYTRMQTRESVSKASSAFMIDLAQVSLALRGVTSRSLVILDEFGKGTLTVDGAGLLAGVIEHLLNGACPRTIVLTHFHELFTQQFIDDSLPILHCHMKTILTEGTKTMEYLYQLTPGKSLTSNAAECALAHGLPRHIVERGKQVSEMVSRFELARLHDTDLTPQDVRELREAERLAKKFLEWEIDENTQDVMDVLKDIITSTSEQEDEEDPIPQDEDGIEVVETRSNGKRSSATINVIRDDAGDGGQTHQLQIQSSITVKQEREDDRPSQSPITSRSASSTHVSSTDTVQDGEEALSQSKKMPGYTDSGRWKGKGRAAACTWRE